MTLDDLLAATRALPAEAPLVFSTEEGPIGRGYHVTELKRAAITSVDCGGRTDAWSETILQLLDGQGADYMTAGKFAAILGRSVELVDGLGAGALRVEFAHGNAGMRTFDPAAPEMVDGAVSLRLRAIHAQCKPAVEATRGTGQPACCGPSAPSCCG
ncbi:MAG: DUF6428 family protein [Pseudomonadota bacterium]